MLGMDMPEPGASAGQPYRVLARTYRPQSFAELIGQDAMVRTLGNAIGRDRLAHAFLMTGVRGVGKTTTARLIAKALNCIGPDGQGGPTIDPCGVCDPCRAIAEGRHIDVIEMDAASNTSVEDVREVIDAVRYAAVSARYKIYIIDEVHMLSKHAFNALLKTLEEPPAHVKFIFATTEVNKIPVTVLSRCQRFDLRRIPPDLLFDHFRGICAKEGVAAEDAALQIIAAAAQGSVRDGLSILDQAIAHADRDGAGTVTAAQVRNMLGLADGGATRTLLSHILNGKGDEAIDTARAQYALGAEPLSMVHGLMRLVHGIALTRSARSGDPGLSDDDRAAVSDWAAAIGMAQTQRLWQLLVKAADEVNGAPEPSMALEMALLRLCHASTMPDPDELARLLVVASGGKTEGAAAPATATPDVAPASPEDAPSDIGAPAAAERGAPALTPPPVQRVEAERPPAPPAVNPAHEPAASVAADALSLASIAARLADAGEHRLASQLRREGRVIALEPGRLELAAADMIDAPFVAALSSALGRVMGGKWDVGIGNGPAAPTLAEQAAADRAAQDARLRTHPVVAATLAAFPGARIVTDGQDRLAG